jgi:hypothetical protein
MKTAFLIYAVKVPACMGDKNIAVTSENLYTSMEDAQDEAQRMSEALRSITGDLTAAECWVASYTLIVDEDTPWVDWDHVVKVKAAERLA